MANKEELFNERQEIEDELKNSYADEATIIEDLDSLEESTIVGGASAGKTTSCQMYVKGKTARFSHDRGSHGTINASVTPQGKCEVRILGDGQFEATLRPGVKRPINIVFRTTYFDSKDRVCNYTMVMRWI